LNSVSPAPSPKLHSRQMTSELSQFRCVQSFDKLRFFERHGVVYDTFGHMRFENVGFNPFQRMIEIAEPAILGRWIVQSQIDKRTIMCAGGVEPRTSKGVMPRAASFFALDAIILQPLASITVTCEQSITQ